MDIHTQEGQESSPRFFWGNLKKQKFIWGLAVLLAAAAVIAGFYFVKKITRNAKSPATQTDVLNRGEVRELPDSQVPGRLPAEFLTEQQVKIYKNYISMSEDGKLSSVREYASGKTMEQNAAAFLDILQKGNWNIIDNIQKPDQVIFTADKENNRLRIVIKPDLSNNKALVLIGILVK